MSESTDNQRPLDDEHEDDEIARLVAENSRTEKDTEDVSFFGAKNLQSWLLSNGAADYRGNKKQALLSGLRSTIGHLSSEERPAFEKALEAAHIFDNRVQLDQFLHSCPEPAGAPHFKFLTFAELLSMPPKPWLVDHLIGAGDLVMLYGPPGGGKTFIVIDLIFSVCLGLQYASRFDVTRPMTVAYCAGEGQRGLSNRFAAAAEHYGVVDLPNFHFTAVAPQLFNTNSYEHVSYFITEWLAMQAASRVGPLDLLIIDTMHAAIVGADENSSQDMNVVLEMAKRAVNELGCTVLILHHTNKAGTAERGSSSLKGAMDTQIEVKPDNGKFVMHCEKLKDEETWKDQTFDLVKIGLSARVWWDEPAVGETKSAPDNVGIALLAMLRANPNKRFSAKSLSEAIGANAPAAQNALSKLTFKKEIERELRYPEREQSPVNPWMYFYNGS